MDVCLDYGNLSSMKIDLCCIEGCTRPIHVKQDSLCWKHYSRKWYGKPMLTEKERFTNDNPPQNGIGKVPLGRGLYALVDEEDYERVMQHVWNAGRKTGRTHYASTHTKMQAGNILMHRFILNPPADMAVDHINGDGLDNRKCNLRICMNTDNLKNSRPMRNKKYSKYKGVGYHLRDSLWKATLVKDGRAFARYFKSEIEAAMAYDMMAREKFGEYAYLNFPSL